MNNVSYFEQQKLSSQAADFGFGFPLMWRDRMEESRPLWVFMQVAHLGTVSAAANAMLLSSAAIRKTIGKLEAQLKTPLIFQGRTTAETPGSAAQILEIHGNQGVFWHSQPCHIWPHAVEFPIRLSVGKLGQAIVDFKNPIGECWRTVGTTPTFIGNTNYGLVMYGKKESPYRSC